MNQKIRISFIAHSFKEDEDYFFDKNYCVSTFQKEVPFEEIGSNLAKEIVAVYFDEEFTFVLNTVPEKEKLVGVRNEFLNEIAKEKVFSTNIYSIFGRLIFLEGDLSKDNFQFKVKDDLKDTKVDSAIIPKNIFFKILSFFSSRKKTQNRKIMVLTHSFCNLIKAPNFSYQNTIRNAKFKLFYVQKATTKYLLKNVKASRFAPFTMDMGKAIDLSPTTNGFSIPELRSEQNEIVTDELYQTASQEHIRYGAINPAKVLKHNPFVVSAYSHSLDCVVILNFPAQIGKKLQQKYKINQKLLAINTYSLEAESGCTKEDEIEIDLIEGEKSHRRWKNVLPLIADFMVVNKDKHLINYIQREILENEEWERLNDKTSVYFKKFPSGCRLGLLIYHRYPTASFLKEYFPERMDESIL